MAKKIEDRIEELSIMWSLLGKYVIELGVISNNSKRKDTVDVGLTNAELLYIHEHGTIANGGFIPARPVLDLTLQHVKKKMLPERMKIIEKGMFSQGWTKEDVELELQQLCMDIQSYAQNLIGNNDGRLAKNAPSTAKAKGGNHPLQDTGALKRSITCQLKKVQ